MVGQAGPGSNFFGSLISESGWIGSLSDQPVMGRVMLGRITRFDSSKRDEKHCEKTLQMIRMIELSF